VSGYWLALKRAQLTDVAQVPVVDARTQRFRLPEDIKNLDRFKPFDGGIPIEAVVLVGFLTSKSMQGTEPRLSHNLQWVAVVGDGN
jgi:hypothetical protein